MGAVKRGQFVGSDARLWFLMGVSIVLLAILGTRLAYLQTVRQPYFAAVAERQRQRAAELAPARGTIYVAEGRDESDEELFPVATNQQAWVAYAVPRDMDDPAAVANLLAPQLLAYRQRQADRTATILEQTGQLLRPKPTPAESIDEPTPTQTPDPAVELRDQLFAKLNRKTDPFEPLLRPYEVLDDELRSFLEDQSIPGVVLQQQEVRIYPEKTLLAHVLGYVGQQAEEYIGRYGIEGFFEQELAGSLGFFSSERDTRGQYIGVGQRVFDPAQDGHDIVLTINRVVQSFAEDELKAGVEKFGAERGSIIVMDPKTGGVLGMATYPTFDPNQYYAINDPRVQLNPTVSEIFEPGSILKPVIMAAAINEGQVTPDTTMVDSGPVRVAEYTIDTFDSKHHGTQTMTQVLEQSNNVGMVWVGQGLGAETMYDYLRRFGFGEKTGVELEGETRTNVIPPNEWNVTTVATTSFGQGIAVTPLQVLNAINALANGGQLMEPHVVDRLVTETGEVIPTSATSVRQVVTPQTAEQLAAMMVSVIENGVATLARVPGYHLAGKTGTAQVPDERGRYSPNRKIITFVGFGPLEDPRFSILIKLDNPSGLSFASGTAAPMFRNLAEKLLQYYQIPPSYDDTTRQPQFTVSN